ncbi:hypothetical protein OG21DRAFT_1376640, partial [Imleria badia]
MLDYAITHGAAVDAITQRRDLQKYELGDGEWNILTELRDLLKILKDATVFFSRATPNLATVIPVMDHIDDYFTTKQLDEAISPTARFSITIAKQTLNRYYELTDSADASTNHNNTVLHPRHKLTYFKNAGWLQEWIDTAEKLVRDTFELNY